MTHALTSRAIKCWLVTETNRIVHFRKIQHKKMIIYLNDAWLKINWSTKKWSNENLNKKKDFNICTCQPTSMNSCWFIRFFVSLQTLGVLNIWIEATTTNSIAWIIRSTSPIAPWKYWTCSWQSTSERHQGAETVIGFASIVIITFRRYTLLL